MRIRPIPKKLLQHKFILKRYLGRVNNKNTFGDEELIEDVYIEYATKGRQNSNGNYISVSGQIIFIDAVNSKYTLLDDFKVKSEIIINGKTHIIDSVEVIQPMGRIHHLEVFVL